MRKRICRRNTLPIVRRGHIEISTVTERIWLWYDLRTLDFSFKHMSHISQFDELITSRSLLTHYFYEQKWNKGELTEEDMKTYAKEYYHLVRNIPVLLETVRSRAVSRGLSTEMIDENLKEEREHVQLWEQFAGSLGLTAKDVQSHVPDAKVAGAVSNMKKIAEGEFEDGVALMYSLELDLPAIAQSKKEGLTKHYGLDGNDAHEYFDEHLNEEEHLKVWRKYSVDAENAESTVRMSLSLQHQVLDGVCDACGISMDCD